MLDTLSVNSLLKFQYKPKVEVNVWLFSYVIWDDNEVCKKEIRNATTKGIWNKIPMKGSLLNINKFFKILFSKHLSPILSNFSTLKIQGISYEYLFFSILDWD